MATPVTEWLSWVVVPTVLFAWWLHWRAAKTPEVRLVLSEIGRVVGDFIAAGGTSVGQGAGETARHYGERLETLIDELHDNRLAFGCKAVLADCRRVFVSYQVEDALACLEHVDVALDRIRHLEHLALRRPRASERPSTTDS